MMKVAGASGHPAAAGAACAAVFATYATHGAAVRTPFAASCGFAACVRVIGNPYVELSRRAAAAGCLWNYLVPDKRVGPPYEGTSATLKRTQQRAAAKDAGKPASAATSAGAVRASVLFVDMCSLGVWFRSAERVGHGRSAALRPSVEC